MSKTVDLALELLEANYWLAKDGAQQTVATRLALRVLRPHAPRQWLVDYWDACGHDDPVYRQQDMNRCLKGIRLRLQP